MAMSYASKTTLDTVLKEVYDSSGVVDAIGTKFPFLQIVKRNTNFGGRHLHVPIAVSHNTSPSSTPLNAVANTGTPFYQAWDLTPASLYAPSAIESIALESVRGDKDGFVAEVKNVAEKAILALSQNLNALLYRNAGGLAQVASYGSGTGPNSSDKITLTKQGDIHSFSKGMILSVTNGSTETNALRTGYFTVSYIDRANGWVAGTAGGTLSGVTANDWLVLSGSAADGSTVKTLRGLDAWIPLSAPSYGTTFFGVERTYDSGLVGSYISSSFSLAEEALIQAVSVAGEMGGNVDLCFIHPTKYRDLIKQLGAKVSIVKDARFAQDDPRTSIGFSGVQIIGDNGPVDVIADASCPVARAYAIDSAHVTLHSIGDPIKWHEVDGSRWINMWGNVSAPVDGAFCVAKSYSQLCVDFPGSCSSVLLP